MADTFKKIEKEFLLSDSSLNSYKYRLLTSGYLLDEFRKNPIGYYMHGTTTEYPREKGVLVKWDNLRVDGDKVYGKPCINLGHPRGQRTVDEIESGFLNAASFGHFVVLEVSDKPEDYLEGQEGPTVSKWFNRECSLVDVPGNYNALTELFDAHNNPLQLAELIASQKLPLMKQIFLTPEQLGVLNLKADTDAPAVDAKIKDLVAEAAKVPGLNQQIQDLKVSEEAAKKALNLLIAEQGTTTIENLISQAVTDKKVTVEVGNQLKVAYKDNAAGLKALIAAMPVYQSITEKINEEDKELASLVAMSYDDLDKGGKLEELKAKAPESFKAKFKAQFGTDYKG